MKRATVLIVVRGGVADFLSSGPVDVEILDWDNVDVGDECYLSNAHRALLGAEALRDLDKANRRARNAAIQG